MKKTLALFLLLALALCPVLAGHGSIAMAEDAMSNTIWIANAYKYDADSAPVPVDGDDNGMALVFAEDTVTLIDCDGIPMQDIGYQCDGTLVTFGNYDPSGIHAELDSDGFVLRLTNGQSWWLMIPANIDTANAYINQLLSGGKGTYIIGAANDDSDGEEDLQDYLGEWRLVDEEYCTLILREEYGSYAIDASFYRMTSFSADFVGYEEEDHCPTFRSKDGLFTCYLYLYSDMICMYVDSVDDYWGYFDGSEFIYAPLEPLRLSDWLGTWECGPESLEVTRVSDSGIVLIYTGLTDSGESTFTTEYVLDFVDGDLTIAAEPAYVEEQSGWRRIFILNQDCITMLSRYPDQDFVRREGDSGESDLYTLPEGAQSVYDLYETVVRFLNNGFHYDELSDIYDANLTTAFYSKWEERPDVIFTLGMRYDEACALIARLKERAASMPSPYDEDGYIEEDNIDFDAFRSEFPEHIQAQIDENHWAYENFIAWYAYEGSDHDGENPFRTDQTFWEMKNADELRIDRYHSNDWDEDLYINFPQVYSIDLGTYVTYEATSMKAFYTQIGGRYYFLGFTYSVSGIGG